MKTAQGARWPRRIAALAAWVLIWVGASAPAGAGGLLLPKDAQLPPLAVKTHRVQIEVTDEAAVTKVEQVFVNHTDQPLEATFYFPIPRGGVVSGLNLWINGQKTPGAALEKDKARQIYEDILRRVRDPALVEYVDSALFQARVFPIPPHGEQKVEISFAAVLERTGGMRRLVYPLRSGRSASVLLEDLTIDLRLRSGAPLGAIYSPSHRVAVARSSDHEARASVEQTGADLEEDFLLYIGAREDEVGMSLLSFDKDGPGGEDGFFLMALSPRFEVKEEERPKLAVTFVVDTSGSMIGEKMTQARAALEAALRRLRPGDEFNIVSFSTSTRRLFARPQAASAANVQQGLGFLKALEAAGGTAIDDALTEALGAPPADAAATHFVLFVTDGRPTVGATSPEEILARAKAHNQRKARIFTVGVGYDLNPVLLDALAVGHGGASDYLRPGEDLELRVGGIFDKIAWPVMTDLKLVYGADEVYDTWPKRLPDLFRGGQLVILGRTRGELSHTIRLEGLIAGRPVGVELKEIKPPAQAASAANHDFIPPLWAARKVAYLLDQIRVNGEDPELKQEVVRLALAYGLVTPYTSFLAVDDSELDHRPPPVARKTVYDFQDDVIDGQFVRPDANRINKEQALRDSQNLQEQGGKGSVDFSIANNEQKTTTRRAEAQAERTRNIDGRLFVYEGGAWVEQGAKGKKQRKVKYLSPEYMKLVEEEPALRKRLSVGEKVTVDFADEAILVE